MSADFKSFGTSRPTPVVQEEATRTVEAIKRLLSAMPKEEDIGIPSDRERIWHARRTLSGIVTELTSPFEGRLVKLDQRLAERRNWYFHLTACKLDLEKDLAKAERVNFREADELRNSLRLLTDGSDQENEFFATPVVRWLQARGFRPEPGAQSYFAGRGSLLEAEHDLAELAKERDAIIAKIETSLTYAKQFIGGMAAPVGQVKAELEVQNTAG